MNNTDLINRTNVKSLLLGLAEAKWPGKFKQVGSDVYEKLNDDLRLAAQKFVMAHPTVGKRLTTGVKKRTSDER